MGKTIKFNSEMIKAIDEGRKTQTRRPLKPQPKYTRSITHSVQRPEEWALSGTMGMIICPYGQVGDQLATLQTDSEITEKAKSFLTFTTIEITDIRVERVQEIKKNDVIAEGLLHSKKTGDTWFKSKIHTDGITRFWAEAFECLWTSIYGKDAWERNDWVWVIEFKKIT